MRMEPRYGVSRPATARSSVVLPLPEGPSTAATFPAGTVTDTPLRASLSPYRSARSLTVRSTMQTHSEPAGNEQAHADHHHIDDGERRNEVDCACAPKRYQERADDFRPGPEQIKTRRIFAHEDQEDERPDCQHAGANQGHGDVEIHAEAARSDRASNIRELRSDPEQRAGNEPHSVGEPDNRISEPNRDQRLPQRSKRLEEQKDQQDCQASDQSWHGARRHDEKIYCAGPAGRPAMNGDRD